MLEDDSITHQGFVMRYESDLFHPGKEDCTQRGEERYREIERQRDREREIKRKTNIAKQKNSK